MSKNQIAARMVFDNAANFATALGYDVRKARLTQSYLRSEVAINTTNGSFHVPILVTDTKAGAVRVCEQRLNLQDIFYVSSVFIGFTSATATSGSGKLYTHPNPIINPTGSMQTLYNGKYVISMNNDNVLPAWDVARHLYVPRTQENTNFNVASPTSPAVYTKDNLDFSEDAFAAVEPGWVFNGGGNIDANIILPESFSAVPANGAIVVIHRGILIQNATTVK